MSSETSRKKRSHSFFYKIYRRIKFIRYKKKVIKREKLENKKRQIQEQKEKLLHLKEFKLTEKHNHRLKQKAERDAARKLKRELKKEFRQRSKQEKQEWQKLSLEDKKKRKLDRLEEKRAKRRQFRHNFKTAFKNFFLSFRSINIGTFKRKIRNFRENAPNRRRFVLIAFNSSVIFLLSYFTLFLLSQAVTIIAASFFDYPVIVYYYEIYFNISQEAWFHDSVKTIFSSGPLVNFVIGITFLIIYSNIRETAGTFKLFFLWGFLHAVNMLFGALLVGTLFEAGVGHVISWMYIMDTGKVLYSIISLFLLVIAGLLATKQFIISGNAYYSEINKSNRTSFIIAQVLIPYLAGNVVLFLIRQPRFVFYDTFIVITLIISIIPILATYRSYNELYFEEEEKKPGINWIALLVMVIFVAVFRGLLAIGLHFGG